MSKTKVLLTGANGFVGSALAKYLSKDNRYVLLATVRREANNPKSDYRLQVVGDLDVNTNWTKALLNIGTVIHTAARVHVMSDPNKDPLTEYRRINVEGTLNLARQAIAAKVHRFIFLSSIKVNGETTSSGRPFTAEDTPQPVDPYGIAKWEAEKGLKRLATESGMELVIIRPPLIYGPGVKGNFATMLRWVKLGVPMPLGAITNKRSFVSLDNLIDLIATCIEHPAAINQTFLVGDDEDMSTTELLRRIGEALGIPVRLIPVPVNMLLLATSILGKKSVAQRLFDSLQVDISKTRNLLGWKPPVSVEEGLQKTVENFK